MSESASRGTASPLVVFLLSLTLIACGRGIQTTSSRITVTLGTFSGRPNPEWELEQAQATVLQDNLETLDPTDESFDSMGLPPYGGFRLEGEGIMGSARFVEVYDGVVLLLDDDFERLSQLGDREYRMEAYLFETPASQVNAEVYNGAFARFRRLTTE
jgi:hypothetical protein